MTKTQKRKLARNVRKCLSLYLLYQEKYIQDSTPDWADRSASALLVARCDLQRLIEGDSQGKESP